MTAPAKNNGRLASLDILRGLDLFLLLFLQPVLVSLGRLVDAPWYQAVMYQLDHEVWEGFRVWDIIMPLFLFMTGAAMPFSFSKIGRDKGAKARIYRKVIRRVVILWIFGMIVQGNLLALDPGRILLYTNTLQAIAAGYLIAALILINFNTRGQIAATVILLLAFSLPFSILGDFSPEGNFANRIDSVLMGARRGDPSYTWIWSSLTFGVTVMLGAFAGKMMKAAGKGSATTARRLALTGLVLVTVAWLWSFETPVIKRIWSGSMTLLSGGYCFLLMALFYWIVDCKGRSKGLGWLKIYGMNSITAYIIGEVVSFRSVAESLTFGLHRYLGDYYSVWLTFANCLILFLILAWMYRNRIFLKI